MQRTNFEWKARTSDLALLEHKLLSLSPLYKGEDHQIDTYFNVGSGRLKLREGNIENALIYYERENISGSKQSNVLLYAFDPDASLKAILVKVHGIKAVVDKTRRIYFIAHVKFHFDRVLGLGTFVEVEAIDPGNRSIADLEEDCKKYADFLGIRAEDFESRSYSDLILEG